MNIKSRFTHLLKSQFLNDSFWALLGSVLAKGMTLVGAIVVARFLGKEIFGEYGTIRSTLMNIAIFSTFGLGYTATKFIAEHKKKNPKLLLTIKFYTMRISLTVSCLMAVLLFCSADFVAKTILEAPHLVLPLRLVSFWVVFNSLTTAQIGILSGLGAYKAMAKISLLIGIIAFVTSVLFTYLYGLNGALTSLLLTQICNFSLNYLKLKKLLPNEEKIDKKPSFLKTMLKFSLPIALQEAVYAFSAWFMILILIKLTDYSEVGIYSAAVQWSAVVLFIPGVLRNVILTHLSVASSDSVFHKKILKQTLLINFGCTFIPFIIIYFFTDLIVSFYGESFKGNLETVLSISLLTVVFISLSNVYSQAYMSINKNWLMFGFRFFRDISILILTFYFINTMLLTGAYGLVLSTFIVNLFFLLLMAITFHFYIQPYKFQVK